MTTTSRSSSAGSVGGQDRTRIETPFGATTTAADVVAGVDLHGRRAVVTGGASGIGVETALALASAGADVTIAVRDLAAGDRTAASIEARLTARADPGGAARPGRPALRGRVRRRLAGPAGHPGEQRRCHGRAGDADAPGLGAAVRARTTYGHFALASGLHDALAAADGARLVSVSSSRATCARPSSSTTSTSSAAPYEPWSAYGQSKTANVLLAVEATRRWAGDGITANAVMPGGIRTNLQRYVSDEELDRLRAAAGSEPPQWKTPQQGAATSVLLAASPLVEGVSGRYFEDCNEAPLNEEGSRRGVAAYALDPDAAQRLWSESLATLGLS